MYRRIMTGFKTPGWLMRVWGTPALALKVHKTFRFAHLFSLPLNRVL